MLKQLKKHNEGFTIIEVLIVLAIAGLILLIVFLAVPALQRNSRNTSYRSEATRLLAVTTEFTNNNNGTLPASSTCSGTGGGATNCDTVPATLNAQSIWQLAAPKNITGFTVVNPGTVTVVTPTLTTATLEVAATCPASVSGTTVTPVTSGAPARSIILIYAIESSSGNLAQCTAS